MIKPQEIVSGKSESQEEKIAPLQTDAYKYYVAL